MSRRARGNLSLGAAVVELLIPQRRPLLLVDFVSGYSDEPVPTLEAGRHVSINEPIFEGHFPGMPVWPGAFTMEGLGQSCSLMLLLTRLRRSAVERSVDPETVFDSLRNLDRGYRMHPGFRPDEVEALTGALAPYRSLMAMGASVELKFLRPVLPGCRLDYRVQWTDEVGDMVRFDVEASVDGETVVRGTLTGATRQRPFVSPG